MLLNCDLGEGMPFDKEIIPCIDMANIACGAHAGSDEIMRETISAAKTYSVEAGAHPGYPDRKNFGRVSIKMEPSDIKQELIKQIDRLQKIALFEGTNVSYVKPHGALYNDMMRDEDVFEAILQAISDYDKNMRLMILSSPQNSRYQKIAGRYDIDLLYEMFADRNYTDEGYLVPRSKPNAAIHDTDKIAKRIEDFRQTGHLQSIGGKELQIDCDTICVHGDNEESLEVTKILRNLIGPR